MGPMRLRVSVDNIERITLWSGPLYRHRRKKVVMG
jgi:hypothetical protein